MLPSLPSLKMPAFGGNASSTWFRVSALDSLRRTDRSIQGDDMSQLQVNGHVPTVARGRSALAPRRRIWLCTHVPLVACSGWVVNHGLVTLDTAAHSRSGRLLISQRRRGCSGCLSTRGREGTDQERPGVVPTTFHPAPTSEVPGSLSNVKVTTRR